MIGCCMLSTFYWLKYTTLFDETIFVMRELKKNFFSKQFFNYKSHKEYIEWFRRLFLITHINAVITGLLLYLLGIIAGENNEQVFV